MLVRCITVFCKVPSYHFQYCIGWPYAGNAPYCARNTAMLVRYLCCTPQNMLLQVLEAGKDAEQVSFEYRKQRYVYSPESDTFELLKHFDMVSPIATVATIGNAGQGGNSALQLSVCMALQVWVVL